MNNALRRCGFNVATAQYLINQGFETPDKLLLASESDFDSIARTVARTPPPGAGNVTMPFIAVKHLKGFRFWADERKRTGFDADPGSFTAADVSTSTAKCQEYQEQKEAAKDEDASKPDNLKKLVNWALWNESFQNYLRQILGAAKIPLVYLSRDERETPVVLDPEDFSSPTEYLIEATILSGRHYELDNPRFYRELKSFTVNGEGWSYIKKFEKSQDGRKAYLALRTQCEGTASKITRKNKAYASISNATYSGSRRQYKFQDYINTHQTAHNEILDCDPTEAIPESKKVSDFLKGITDPKLESAVSVVLGDPKMLNDFQMCQQYLSTTVENRATLEKSKERNISGVKSGADRSDKKGKGKLPKGFKLENKWYPPRIFRLLSQEQQDQLREWNEKKGKRSVAALKKELKKELKTEMKKKSEKGSDDEDDSSADDAAGKEFGRGAHKKKQKKDNA
jgi:hypothetical protein